MLNAQAVSTFIILFPPTSSPNTQLKKIDNFVLGPSIHKATTEKNIANVVFRSRILPFKYVASTLLEISIRYKQNSAKSRILPSKYFN